MQFKVFQGNKKSIRVLNVYEGMNVVFVSLILDHLLPSYTAASRGRLTSRLVEAQSHMSVEAQAEVVVEDVNW